MAGSTTTINVLGNLNLTLGTLNDNGDAIYVTGNVYNSGLHSGGGKISLNGTAAQTIDGNGIFQNLELNNTTSANAAPVSLDTNTTVNGTLNLLSNKIFNIGIYNLALGASASVSGTLSNTCYIHTNGQSGDGGVSKVYNASNTTFSFPIGCFSTNRTATYAYTPATIGIVGSPTYGTVTVIPAGYEHPATTANGQSLTFFWRIKSSGFSGSYTVNHTFVYSPTDIVGSIGNYVPSLYSRSNYTWNSGLHTNINTTTCTITDWTSPTISANFLDADYTAGDNTTNGGAFNSTTKFYSIAGSSGTPAAWNSTATWSHTDGGAAIGGGAVAGSTYPGPNSIVVIDNNHYVNLTAYAQCASLQIASGSTLDIGQYSTTTTNFGMVLSYASGNNGLFRTSANIIGAPGYVFTFPARGFLDFNNNGGTTEFYDRDGTTGRIYVLPTGVTSYGNLIMTTSGSGNICLPNNNVTVNGNLTCTGANNSCWITMTWNHANNPTYPVVIEKTVHVTGNMYVNTGTFYFMDDASGSPQHLIVDGNITVNAGTVFDCYAGGSYGVAVCVNTLAVGGTITNNGTFRLLNGAYYANVTFRDLQTRP